MLDIKISFFPINTYARSHYKLLTNR